MNISSFRKPVVISGFLIASWLLIYSVFGAITPREPTEFYHLRFTEILKVIDGFELPDKPAIMFFGASDIAVNVSPRQIEAQDDSVKVFNFGVMMGGPDLTRELTSRLRENLAPKQKKIKLAVLRWTPMMYTKQYRRNVRRWQYPRFTYNFPYAKILAKTKSLDMDYLSHITFLRLANGAGGQGGLQAGTRWFLNHYLYPTPHQDKIALYVKLWDPRALSDHGRFWNARLSGEVDFFTNDQEDLSDFVEQNAEALYSAGFGVHRYLFDHLNFDFDSEFFADFEHSVNDLLEVAEHLAVLYIPDLSLPGYPTVTDEGNARLAEKIQTFKLDKRFQFWDFSEMWEPGPRDFIDITHMSKTGKVRFNNILVRLLHENRGQ